MTVLVGVLCKDDAVVIGTDSSATFGIHPQHPTIEQKPCKKLFQIKDDMLVAGTGQIGLCQRFLDVVTHYRGTDNKGVYTKSKFDVGKGISAEAQKDFGSTGAPKAQFGSLVAFATKQDKCSLVEFASADLQPEWKTADLWFVSMGSGIDGPPQIGVLKKDGDNYKAKILSDDELQEHISRVADAEKHLRKFLDLDAAVQTSQPPIAPS